MGMVAHDSVRKNKDGPVPDHPIAYPLVYSRVVITYVKEPNNVMMATPEMVMVVHPYA